MYKIGYDDGTYSEFNLFNSRKFKTIKKAVAFLKVFFKYNPDENKNSYFICPAVESKNQKRRL